MPIRDPSDIVSHRSRDAALRLVVDRCEAHVKELLGWQRGDLFRESSGDWQQDDCGCAVWASMLARSEKESTSCAIFAACRRSCAWRASWGCCSTSPLSSC